MPRATAAKRGMKITTASVVRTPGPPFLARPDLPARSGRRSGARGRDTRRMQDHHAFRIVPIDAAVADRVRLEQRSPQYGHPATIEVAKGYGPCRQCLRTFRAGEEERILFTYNPVPKGSGLPQPGPVFIHKDPCRPFDGAGLPADLLGLPLFLEGFGRGTWSVRREPVDPQAMDADIAAMLRDPAIELVQIRNAEAGCFVARVVRA